MNRNQATFPSLKRRGGCGINQYREATELPQTGAKRERDSAKHKIVVRSANAFRPNDFAGLTTIYASRYRARASRPSARTKVASRYFFDRASTPPFQGGGICSPDNSFTPSTR